MLSSCYGEHIKLKWSLMFVSVAFFRYLLKSVMYIFTANI